MKHLLGFLGYGEAAYHISTGLKQEGIGAIAAFDVKAADPQAGQVIRDRAAQVGVDLAASMDELVASSTFIASLTSAGVAVAIAEQVIPTMKAGQVYVDMNSASPMVKEKIAALPRPEGALVCDAAVMNPVPGAGHKVPITLAGDGAAAFLDALSPYGMNLENLNAPAGAAAAIKMFRSVFMKGLPQLLMEAMIPALKYGALDALTASLSESLAGKSVEQLANQFIPRTVIHAERRAHEMADAVATLEEMGCEAAMSRATERRLELLARSGLGAKIPHDGKIDYRDALKLLI